MPAVKITFLVLKGTVVGLFPLSPFWPVPPLNSGGVICCKNQMSFLPRMSSHQLCVRLQEVQKNTSPAL